MVVGGQRGYDGLHGPGMAGRRRGSRAPGGMAGARRGEAMRLAMSRAWVGKTISFGQRPAFVGHKLRRVLRPKPGRRKCTSDGGGGVR